MAGVLADDIELALSFSRLDGGGTRQLAPLASEARDELALEVSDHFALVDTVDRGGEGITSQSFEDGFGFTNGGVLGFRVDEDVNQSSELALGVRLDRQISVIEAVRETEVALCSIVSDLCATLTAILSGEVVLIGRWFRSVWIRYVIVFERVVDAFVATVVDGSRVGRIGGNTSFVFGSELPAVVIVVVHGVV